MTKLHNHLIQETINPINPKQIISGDNYRLTIITPCLLRIEVSTNGVFTDYATQSVINRSFQLADYQVSEKGNILEIITEKVLFYFNKSSQKVSFVSFDGGNSKVKCSNARNLKGTTRTLDVSMGFNRLDNGLMSRSGVAIYDDSKTLIIAEDGLVKPRVSEGSDIYIFAYGNNYRACLDDFYKLCGESPLISRYVLGNWWSRYKAYQQQEYIDLMQKFIDKKIPITLATVDMDWHWVKLEKKYTKNFKSQGIQGAGWTGYSWNTDLFPNYKDFLKWLQSKGLHTTLNLHPADGIRPFEVMYKEMAIAMGIDPATEQSIPFDITDPKFINAYFDILHKPYEKDGVDFWWIDWQQGTKTAVKGLDPLWALNHYHYLDNGLNKRPMILSRYAGVGGHRYPLGFSGDTFIYWSSLRFQPYFTANATNVGYTWWSHDIGGHMFGINNDEMYMRWVQLGVFSPIMRLHSTSHDLQGKEPWFYRKDIENYTSEFMRLRHKLIPYLYSMNYRNHAKSIAICEPMYYNYPESEGAYKVRNQYFFGSELIVCPITSKLDKRTFLAKTKAWIPKGRWTDIFTGRIYNGEQLTKLYRGLESIPVLAKEGAIIPLANDLSNNSDNPQHITVWAYRGNSSFELYEDNGIDNKYKEGEFAITTLSINENDDIEFKIEKTQGLDKCIPKDRKYTIIFKDIISANKIAVIIDGKSVDYEANTQGNVSVTIDKISPTQLVNIKLSEYQTLDNISNAEHAMNILSSYQGSNLKKKLYYKGAIKDCSKAEFVKKIKRLPVNRTAKGAIIELVD